MDKERKICLPFYKIAYSVFFIAILSVIRGISSTAEIGIAMETPLAMLAAVFCADTYVQEIVSKRSEVGRLCPMKNRVASVCKRLMLEEIYLLFLAVAGYGMFFVIQKPRAAYGVQAEPEKELGLFLAYVLAIVVTLNFWGILSHTLACLFRSMWAGIGCCLALWIVTNSLFGEKIFGKWNLFSYTFREVENGGDLRWLCGKAVCVSVIIAMGIAFPKIMEKRG